MFDSMAVELAVRDIHEAGTNNGVFVGLFGSDGGSEYNLRSNEGSDYRRGSKRVYIFGTPPSFYRVPLFYETVTVKHNLVPPAGGGPSFRVSSFSHVFLRKSGNDDLVLGPAGVAGAVVVHVFGNAGEDYRIFTVRSVHLGEHRGLQTWLREDRILPVAFRVAEILTTRKMLDVVDEKKESNDSC